MNTNKFTLISLIACCIISINTYAQFSIGGTPKGFSPKINQSIPIAKMPAFDPTAMLSEDETLNQKGNGPYRFGKNFDVNLNQSNAGSWFTYANGDRLWQLEISSTNAYSINLQFSYYHLPPDAEMFIYNKTKSMVIGAFTHLNNQEDGLFATDLVQGDKIVVEYFEPLQVRGLGAFNISTVTHAYRNIFSEEFTKGFGPSRATTSGRSTRSRSRAKTIPKGNTRTRSDGFTSRPSSSISVNSAAVLKGNSTSRRPAWPKGPRAWGRLASSNPQV
jgi:hypothetical protein